MAVMTSLGSTLWLLLLLTVVVFAVVGSKNEQTSLEPSLQNFTSAKKNTNITLVETTAKENEMVKSSSMDRVMESIKSKDASWEKKEEDENEDEESEEEEDEEEMDENSGETDEYEDELREIAESHEAMSRDERKNGVSGTGSLGIFVSEDKKFDERHSGTRNFDSHEKSDEIMSDENSMSNEAISKEDDDIRDDDDDKEQVAELLRYKQKSTSPVEKKVVGQILKNAKKVKRVPTVKKELSTQKEILIFNETKLTSPKKLTTSVDIVNRLDDEIKPEMKYVQPFIVKDSSRYGLVRDDAILNEEYPDVETSDGVLRKLDKRQPFQSNRLTSLFLDDYNSEEEQRRKLQELGIEEGILAESLMELFTKLAEDPRLWERVHRILADIKEGFPISRESHLDSRKRANSPESPVQIPMTIAESDISETPSTTKKPKKKKKKKRRRKKLREQLTASTNEPQTAVALKTISTSSPAPPFLTTTAANWPATTQAQWRLVAERLFGIPWSEDRRETSPSATKIRSVKDRLASIDDKQRVNLGSLNDERQALALQSSREYSQPRRLHYGKVNTHEKGSPTTDQNDAPKNYDSSRDLPAIDYDLSNGRSYQQRPISLNRYDHYYGNQRIRDYDPDVQQMDDYDEIFRTPGAMMTNHRSFAKSQQFRPLGRDYASARTWQDSRYNYARPWKDKGSASLDSIAGSASNWPWRNSPADYKIWVPRYQRPWSRDRNYWQRFGNVEDELGEIENDNENDALSRNRQRQRQDGSWRGRNDDIDRWQISGNPNVPLWQVPERPKSHNRIIVPTNLDKSKNRSELSNDGAITKPFVNDKTVLPKITMKTWNSLTSDPATWPFKLTGAKPWPKDKNGNSYNPNAELVRKLGLDKQDRLLSSTKDNPKVINKEILPIVSGKYSANSDIGGNDRNEIGTMADSSKNSVSWPEKLNNVDGWRSKSNKENNRLPQRDEAGQMWRTGVNEDRKMWSEKVPISPKISSVGAWVMPADQSTWRPYDLKHVSYGQMHDDHRGSWNQPINSDDTERRSWTTKNDGMASTWNQKGNNDWNVVGRVYGSDKSTSNGRSSTWPSKWKQFTYHKVTAAPITKTGSLNAVDGSKQRNSYIAVSAVSPPKYPNNEWRKNEIEETQLDRNSVVNHPITYDQDDPSSQLRKSSGIKNERWNKQARIDRPKENDLQRNDDDPLEHQLEELRRGAYWNEHQPREHGQKRSYVRGNSSIVDPTNQTSPEVDLKSLPMENEIAKDRVDIITVTETPSQGRKNVTE